MMSVKAFMSAIRRDQRRVLGGLLTAFMVTVLITLIIDCLLTHSAARQVDGVHQTARRVTHNGCGIRVSARSGSRLSSLNHSFGRVTSTLRTSRRRVHRRRRQQQHFVTSTTRRVQAPLAAVGNLLRNLTCSTVPRRSGGRDVRLVRGSAQHLVHLIGSALSCRGVQAGRVSVSHGIFSTATIVGGLRTRLQGGTGIRGSGLTISLPGILHICTSCSQFIRVVFGVVRGTVRFAGGNGVRVSNQQLPGKTRFTVGSGKVKVAGRRARRV